MLKRIPECKAIVTTGQKATDTLLALVGAEAPKVGGFSDFGYKGRALRLYRMPSFTGLPLKPLEDKAGRISGDVS